VRRSATLFGGLLLLLAACSGLPPLRHKFEVGRDPYLLLVADAPDGRGDLWAMSPDGSDIVQITFSLPAEWSPRLTPSGDVVAFLRSREQGDTARTRVWLLNLLNGSERQLHLPDSSGAPLAIAWTDDGRALVVRTTRAIFRINAPPSPPAPAEVAPAEMRAAERALSVTVGSPAFARVASCEGSNALCVFPDDGPPATLAEGATEPVRWGADSLAYQLNGELVVRPVGPGRERIVHWRSSLVNPRDLTVFTGRRRETP
jgi:hypothetical protein